MKIKDYGLIAVYNPTLSSIPKKELDFCEEWPNLLIGDYIIDVIYMGQKIASMRTAGSDYDGMHRYIEVSYSFPSTPNDNEPFFNRCERIQLKMISKGKDLRPSLVALLRDECDVAIKLPDSDFQLMLVSSLAHYLSENNINQSTRSYLNDTAQRISWSSKIKSFFNRT